MDPNELMRGLSELGKSTPEPNAYSNALAERSMAKATGSVSQTKLLTTAGLVGGIAATSALVWFASGMGNVTSPELRAEQSSQVATAQPSSAPGSSTTQDAGASTASARPQASVAPGTSHAAPADTSATTVPQPGVNQPKTDSQSSSDNETWIVVVPSASNDAAAGDLPRKKPVPDVPAPQPTVIAPAPTPGTEATPGDETSPELPDSEPSETEEPTVNPPAETPDPSVDPTVNPDDDETPDPSVEPEPTPSDPVTPAPVDPVTPTPVEPLPDEDDTCTFSQVRVELISQSGTSDLYRLVLTNKSQQSCDYDLHGKLELRKPGFDISDPDGVIKLKNNSKAQKADGTLSPGSSVVFQAQIDYESRNFCAPAPKLFFFTPGTRFTPGTEIVAPGLPLTNYCAANNPQITLLGFSTVNGFNFAWR